MQNLSGRYLSKFTDRRFEVRDRGGEDITEKWNDQNGDERLCRTQRNEAQRNIALGWWVSLDQELTEDEVIAEVKKTLEVEVRTCGTNSLSGKYLSEYAGRHFKIWDSGDDTIIEIWHAEGVERLYPTPRRRAVGNIEQGGWVRLDKEATEK